MIKLRNSNCFTKFILLIYKCSATPEKSVNLNKQLKMKKISLFLYFLFISVVAFAQPPAGYYDPANGLTGVPLKAALHNIIDNHSVQSYSALLTHYQTTDKKSNGKVWDMYSDVPGGTPPYEYTYTQNCGNYSGEGDCWNREHSWPQSYFNSSSPMQSDLFHVYPTDGYVNGKRSNYAFGEVGTATWTAQNGGKLGSNVYPGYTGTVFEPIDEYKGDFARTYFYMSVRYYTEDAAWQTWGMATKADLKQWAINMLMDWHIADPVSQKETNRNNAVYGIQNNRNPFIDHPEWVAEIWSATAVGTKEEFANNVSYSIYPNPAEDNIIISVGNLKSNQQPVLQVYDLEGRLVHEQTIENSIQSIDLSSFSKGIYQVKVVDATKVYNQKLVLQ